MSIKHIVPGVDYVAGGIRWEIKSVVFPHPDSEDLHARDITQSLEDGWEPFSVTGGFGFLEQRREMWFRRQVTA